ncbi:MAG TPA: hypothetical protein VNT23_05480 [Gaiellaceae bacterium]|nr:hypothetical protein [Gaiellaceae bacterium]
MQVKVLVTAVAAAVVAAVAPGVAAAKQAEVSGPSALAGRSYFGGELKLAGGEAQRPVRITGRIGYVGFLDLGGDLEVRCNGRGRVEKRETENGDVYLCRGAVGTAVVSGSHFKLRGQARQYRVLLPEGASGTWNGNFVVCTKGENGPTCDRRADRAAERQERLDTAKERRDAAKEKRDAPKERAAGKKAGERDAIPTLKELAELLKAATGGK